MASNTDTLPPGTDTGTTLDAHEPGWARRGVLAWAGVVAAGIAVAAFAVAALSGGDDPSDVPTTRFNPQAEAYERQAHLEGQARTYGQE